MYAYLSLICHVLKVFTSSNVIEDLHFTTLLIHRLFRKLKDRFILQVDNKHHLLGLISKERRLSSPITAQSSDKNKLQFSD